MNKCPKCGSTRVRIDYPEITCMACGWSEPLIDYPISYQEHRVYSKTFNNIDLVPEEPPKPAEREFRWDYYDVDDRIGKLRRQVNMLMGQSVYRQQKQSGLPRIDV